MKKELEKEEKTQVLEVENEIIEIIIRINIAEEKNKEKLRV